MDAPWLLRLPGLYISRPPVIQYVGAGRAEGEEKGNFDEEAYGLGRCCLCDGSCGYRDGRGAGER